MPRWPSQEKKEPLDPNIFLTKEDVRDRVRVSRDTVDRWIAAGLLTVHKFGHAVRISPEDYKAFLRQHRKGT